MESRLLVARDGGFWDGFECSYERAKLGIFVVMEVFCVLILVVGYLVYT